jgi:TRAP-type uncharacterized transport system fused permease subunit
MTSLGIDPMAGHMFLLYFAVMSALTPPVAVAVYAASAISGDNPLAIAAMAVRMALAAFLIPFSFVFNRELLLQGSALEIAWATACVAAGLAAIAIAIEGYLRGPLAALPRLCLAAAGILLLFTAPLLAGIAGALVAAALFIQRAGVKAT